MSYPIAAFFLHRIRVTAIFTPLHLKMTCPQRQVTSPQMSDVFGRCLRQIPQCIQPYLADNEWSSELVLHPTIYKRDSHSLGCTVVITLISED